ncbi:YveK family protein [Ureibacillus sp. MALMAid1270]|uniref:YveK family protein n=1 Tax=Ureibacillus sp. MALMAid1270 TaxID=3411629 RepID=UPI003BA74B99
MEIYELLNIIKKRIVLIICIFIFIVSGTTVANFFLLPEIYEAKSQILVNQAPREIDFVTTYVETDIQLIETYNEIIKSPAILDKVVEKLKLDEESEELAEKITVSNNDRSKVVTIKVEDPSPQRAVNLVNTIAEVFKHETPTLMKLDNVNILAKAKFTESMKPVKPKKMLNIAISIVVSIFIGAGLALLIEHFDSRVKNEDQVEKIVNAPVIGYVSPFSTRNRKKSYGRRKRVAKKKGE